MGKVNNNGISAKDFATQIKAKYPEYKDVDDLKLATAMIEKYPTYKDSVYFDTPVEKKNPNPTSASSGMGVSMEFKGSPQQSVTQQILKTIPTSQKKPDEEGLRIWDRAKSTLSTLGKSVVDGVAATSSEQIAILSKTIDDEVREFAGMKPLNKPITEYQTYKLAQQIKETTTDVFKPNPEFQGEIQETVAQTAGDLLGLVASAVITKNPSSALAKLGTKGIIKGLATSATRREITKEIAKESVKMLAKPTTFVAAAQTGTRNYDEALKKGATEDEANAMYWSTALTGGIANNLPVGALLNRFDKASGGKMKEVVLGGVVGGVEEAVTEGIEEIFTNFAAQNIYDETRKLFEGVGESTAMGGGVGFVLNAMGVKLGAMRNKFKDNPEKVAEIDQSIDYLKDIAETSGKSSAVKLSREEQIKVDRLNKTIENPDIPNEAKDVAREQLQQITGAKILDAETTQEKLNSLSEDDKVEVRLLDAEIDRLKQAANSEVDVDIKDALLASIDELNTQKEDIFNAPPKDIEIKAGGNRVVHAGDELISSIDDTKLQSRDSGEYGEGFYVSKTETNQPYYGAVKSYFDINENAKILNKETFDIEEWKREETDKSGHKYEDVLKEPEKYDYEDLLKVNSFEDAVRYDKKGMNNYARKKGFDIFEATPDEIVILNKDAINPVEQAITQALKDVESTAKALDDLPKDKDGNIEGVDLSPLDLENKGIITWNRKDSKSVSEAYHKAKADGSNPELVEAVEKLLGKTPSVEGNLSNPSEIVKTENAPIVPFEQQLDEALDMSSVEEVSTETPLTEREQQMLTVPEDRPINTSIIGKFFENVNTKTKTAPTNPIKRKIYDFITPISKSIGKMMTTGDINAVRAKEIVDAESGATIEKLKSISTKIQNLVGKDSNDRKLANQILSMDFLDDKVSKLAASDNYTALSELTDNKYSPEQIKQAVEFYKGGETEGVSTVDKALFDNIVKDVSGIGQQTIADKKTENAAKVKSLVGKVINYDTVGKTTEDVSVEPTLIQGSQSPMLTGSELAPVGIGSESRVKNVESSTVEPVTLTELRAELASLPNGQEILRTVDESVANRNLAEQELSKTTKGQKILEQAKAGRELMDSFSDYISTNKAAVKIQERIGETIAGNKGSYLKRSFRFWKDKKFEPTEALKNVALESVVNDMMVMELVRLNKSPEYNRLEGDAKRQYLKQITDDVRRKAEITLNTYLDEIRQQRKDGAGFFPNTKAEKIDGKSIEFRKLIDESFLNLLGNINDPISQFHDTVLAQTQIKSAANLHWIINQVTGKENMFDSREQVVEFNGSSEGFKQISDKNSLLDGKWVSEDIYDAISNNAATKDGLGYLIYRKVLSTMRKSKTIYNFFAGWTTNLIGGEVTLMANGIVPNPKNTGKYLLNRLKYVKNPEKLDKDIQDDIQAMKDNGFWSTSISAGTIKLIDDSYLDMTAYDRGEEFVKSKMSRFINKAKRIDDNIIRNYSAIDDFTKLVFFREKKDIFSEKLYGKKYDQLTKVEKDKVHANVAERGKENIATMSRLPRVYQRMAKYPLGDFMAFRISAIKSGVNTIVNALQDINTGTTDMSLSKEQRSAYLRDGYTTMFSMTVAAIANSMFYGQIASFAMGLMSEKDEKIFKKKTDGGVIIGSKADLYTDFKGTPAVSPQWMRGKNNIVSKDDGKGNIELLNISNKDPYDELFGMFLPRAGTDWRETMLGIAKETFSPNMTVNLFTNIMKGEDQWGKDIYTGDDTYTEAGAKITGYILTESLVPPALKNLAKESYKEIQQSKAVQGDTKKDIKEKPVGGKEYLNALVGNTPMLLNRTYKVNLVEQYGFYAKDFYQARPDKFDKLDQETKDKRFEDLSRLRDGYQYLRKYSILNNNPDVLEAAIGILRDNAIGMSKNEENFILYGEKSY